MGVGGQRHAPAALLLGRTQYPLYRRLGGLQGRSGKVRKILPPPGFDPPNVHPVASRYTDWAIPAPSSQVQYIIKTFRRVMLCWSRRTVTHSTRHQNRWTKRNQKRFSSLCHLFAEDEWRRRRKQREWSQHIPKIQTVLVSGKATKPETTSTMKEEHINKSKNHSLIWMRR